MLLISLITAGLTEQIPSCSSEEGFWQGQKDGVAWQGPRQELRSGRGAQECTGGHWGTANTSPSHGDTLLRAAHQGKGFSLLCHSFLHTPNDTREAQGSYALPCSHLPTQESTGKSQHQVWKETVMGHVLNMARQLLPQLGPYTTHKSSQLLPSLPTNP